MPPRQETLGSVTLAPGRHRADVTALFDGLEPVEPGVVLVAD